MDRGGTHLSNEVADFRVVFEQAIAIADDEERAAFLEEGLAGFSSSVIRDQLRVLAKLQTAMTSGDIVEYTNGALTQNEIRHMSKRGEMPAPIYQNQTFGKWYWWDRDEIEEWWEAAKAKAS